MITKITIKRKVYYVYTSFNGFVQSVHKRKRCALKAKQLDICFKNKKEY